MCRTCGCGAGDETRLVNLQTGKETAMDDDHLNTQSHSHAHSQAHAHAHAHAHGQHHEHRHDRHDHVAATTSVVTLETEILAKNDSIAAHNRGWFAGREILALNLVSSPGSGKTTLLERTIAGLKDMISISVIEGDQATVRDGERIRAAGASAVQVNTGAGCHLDAAMVARGLAELKPPVGSVVMIENVGNLVCPALFDLGERAKVVILSVTEGDDKPLKYPHIFKAAEIMVINKIDLLPHVDFDVNAAIDNARKINPGIKALQLSARTGEGLEAWYDTLQGYASEARAWPQA